MLDYFYEGGPLFMGMLSIVFLLVFISAIKTGKDIYSGKAVTNTGQLKSIGLFALVLGFLGQFLGLFQAFTFIAEAGTIAPAILAQGLRVSSITSVYGMIIFLVAYILAFALNLWQVNTKN